jgi:16S rRNA (adenine1518-N6/adenine1519-N6)-dimethyltransferase
MRMTALFTLGGGLNEQLFKQIVKTTINQRRKTLRNSISPILEKGNPLSADPIFNKRPEQLSVQDFIDLTNRVEEALNSSAAKAE